MRRLLLPIAAVLLTAACGSSTHPAAAKPSSAVPATGAPRPSATPSATAAAAPTLAVGQTITVHTTADGLIDKTPGAYQVTLTGIKTATQVTHAASDYTAKAQAGDVFGCISLKIKNLDAAQSDLYPFMNPQWLGADGQLSDVALGGVSCGDMGLPDADLSGEPAPGVGQFVAGSDALEFPAGAGQLVFADRSGAQLFKAAVPPPA